MTTGPDPRAEGSTPEPAPLVLSDLAGDLLAHFDEGLVLTDEAGAMRWMSPTAERLLGVDGASLIGLEAADLIHPTDRPQVEHDVEPLVEPGTQARLEFRVVVDGEVRWIEAVVTNQLDQPLIASVVSLLRDITERKHAEVAVRLEATLLATADQAIAALDPDGYITYWNRGAEQLFGWPRGEALGRHNAERLVAAPDWADLGENARQLSREGRPWTYELHVIRADGTEVPVLATATPLRDRDGRHVATTVVAYDATERHRHQEVASRLASIVATSRDAIFSTDLDGRITSWNEGAHQLFGYPEAAIIGRRGKHLVQPGHRAQLADTFEKVRRGEEAQSIVTLGRRHDGSTLHASMSMSPIITPTGVVTGVSIVAQDVTERHEAQLALAHEATHDPVSGLANRRLFVDRLEASLLRSATTGELTGMVFIDLDDFKQVNDRVGHVDGDQLLRLVGQRIEEVVGSHNTVARLGGDEYGVACDGLHSYADLEALVARVRGALRLPFQIGTESISITASIGLSISGAETHGEALMRHADMAMYAAKQAGGDRFELFDDALYEQRRRSKALVAEIESALDRGEFQTYLQPEISLVDGTLFGFEALVRWMHPDRGVVPPGEFIRIAEKSGTIVRLGHQVLRDACRALVGWEGVAPDHGLMVSVNLSPVQLVDDGLPDAVRRALAESGVAPEQVCLEVTETALMDFDAATVALRSLKDIGVRVAIDDFGTGYSSLSRLKHFPVDFLKIDRSFIGGLGRDADDEAIVTAVIGLASSLGVQVIAEGIETIAQLDRLRELGCPFGQGFLWSPPAPVDQVRAWVDGEPPRPG